MKTEPIETDREAAQLFTPAPGTRAWGGHFGEHRGPVRVLRVEPDGCAIILSEDDEYNPFVFSDGIVAIDTDDPATRGCMIAQVRATDPFFHVEPLAADEFQIHWLQTYLNGHVFESEGAALVAAMRAIRESR